MVAIALLVVGCRAEATSPPPLVPVETSTSPTVQAPLSTDTTGVETIPELPEVTETSTPSAKDHVGDFPDPGLYTWQLITDGFSKPLGMTVPESNPQLFYILEQAGVIRVLREGEILPDPFLDIRKQINSKGNEQGLLGMALDPQYAQNGIFYLNYSNSKGDTTISRFQANPDLLSTDSQSEQILLTQEQPYSNHNGGNLVIGPDGFLYIGFGDGGSGGDPQGNAQNPETLLGKMVRIAVQNQDSYGVPETNPFASGSGGRPEIWAMGLRNPWRFSFDMLTGGLYIADVGQGEWEEINFTQPVLSPNYNYGWDYFEGTHPFEGQPPGDVDFIEPVYEYDHSQGCSVTGGYVYRGTELSEWNGVYFFGDYCNGKIWGMLPDGDGSWKVSLLFESGQNISSFGQDRSGEVYLISHTGSIYKLAKK